jgi:hypothetical protein
MFVGEHPPPGEIPLGSGLDTRAGEVKLSTALPGDDRTATTIASLYPDFPGFAEHARSVPPPVSYGDRMPLAASTPKKPAASEQPAPAPHVDSRQLTIELP